MASTMTISFRVHIISLIIAAAPFLVKGMINVTNVVYQQTSSIKHSTRKSDVNSTDADLPLYVSSNHRFQREKYLTATQGFGTRANDENSNTYELNTGQNGESGSFGIMFDVRALSPIVIKSMKFYTDQITEFYIEVWTKEGTHQGFESNKLVWHDLVSHKTRGAGRDDYTLIPFEHFNDIIIDAGQIQAFYVTLNTPDLRYGVSDQNHPLGSVISSNEDLEVMTGTGVGEKSFGSSFFQGREFNGALLYYYYVPPQPSPAPTPLPIPPTPSPTIDNKIHTDIRLVFGIDHEEKVPVSTILNGIKTYFRKFIWSMIDSSILENADFSCDQTLSLLSLDFELDDEYHCASTIGKCDALNIDFTLSHLECLSPGEVHYHFLTNAWDLEDFREDISLYFVGPIASAPKIIITLSGTGLNYLDSSLLGVFEEVIGKLLQDTIANIAPSGNVMGVSVFEQKISSDFESRRLDWSKIHFSSTRGRNYNSFGTSITGAYMPPPNRDFGYVAVDSINNNDRYFVDGLNSYSGFRNVKSIDAKVISEELQAAANEDITASKSKADPLNVVIYGVIVIVVLGVLLCCVGFACYFRKRKKIASATELQTMTLRGKMQRRSSFDM